MECNFCCRNKFIKMFYRYLIYNLLNLFEYGQNINLKNITIYREIKQYSKESNFKITNSTSYKYKPYFLMLRFCIDSRLQTSSAIKRYATF